MSLETQLQTLEIGRVTRGGNTESLSVDFYTRWDEFDEGVPLVILGFGEEGRVANGVLDWFEARGQQAAVGVTRYTSRDTIEHVVRGAPEVLAAEVNHRRGVDRDAPVNTVSHSLGCGVLLYAAPETPQVVDASHALIAPGSVNNEAWGTTPQQRRMSFAKRLLWDNMRAPGKRSRLLDFDIFLDLAMRVGSDIRHGRLIPKVDFGLSNETQERVRAGIRYLGEFSAKTVILTGVDDKVTPRHERDAGLAAAGDIGNVQTLEIPGAHEGMSSYLGQVQLSQAVQQLAA